MNTNDEGKMQNGELSMLDLLKILVEDHHMNLRMRGNTWHRGTFDDCLADTCINSRKEISRIAAKLSRLRRIEAAARPIVADIHRMMELIGGALDERERVDALAAALNESEPR